MQKLSLFHKRRLLGIQYLVYHITWKFGRRNINNFINYGGSHRSAVYLK